ncbi:formyltetrahydrofolate deformylase [Diaminobutyricibacter sp. McL0618]|uniref:formyltetrahydrofolate deformylase n=1 Tax=Leifsonia sp. McL0618 TaxID=3415677 RepID=UPI003CE8ACD8
MPTTHAVAAPTDLTASPTEPDPTTIGRLLVHCRDQAGIVAAISSFLAERGANIVELTQYSTSSDSGEFFQRTVFHLPDLQETKEDFAVQFGERIASRFDMDWTLNDAATRKRVAIFVSKYDHCLMDLLWRSRRGDLDIDIAMVVSNHRDHGAAVRSFGIPFFYTPLDKQGKEAMETQQLDLVTGNVDLVVLARYMQILSTDFLEKVGVPVINIHHSFLPAFMGANPYARAKDRGVKLIGATAHYATPDLDEGPIIEQDVVRVTHSETAAELQRRGADVERSVLARAVRWHSEDRVVISGRSTVVLT